MSAFGDLRDAFIPYLQQGLVEQYGFSEGVAVRCLAYSENITYATTDRQGRPMAVLQVHKPGYHSPEELRAELYWTAELRRETKVRIPFVFANHAGERLSFFSFPENGQRYYYTVFEYVRGQELEARSAPMAESIPVRVGEIAAELHLQSGRRSQVRPPLPCFRWDLKHLLGPQARWGNFTLYPVDEAARELLNKTAGKVADRLYDYGMGADRYFLIHADLHAGNLLVDGDAVTVIDFDDCGYGWFLYDLAAFLSHENAGLQPLIDGWCSGYEHVRPLSEADLAMIPSFVLLRRLVRLGWLSTRRDNGVARRVGGEYVAATLELAANYLAQDRIAL